MLGSANFVFPASAPEIVAKTDCLSWIVDCLPRYSRRNRSHLRTLRPADHCRRLCQSEVGLLEPNLEVALKDSKCT